ncbi:MAG: hypothetical protein ACREYE_19280, partial [Gammaproteobacteria bacterium]
DIIKKIERARVKMEQIKPGSTLPRGKKEGGLTVKLFKGHYTRIKRNVAGSGAHAFHRVIRSAYSAGTAEPGSPSLYSDIEPGIGARAPGAGGIESQGWLN